MPLPSGNSLRYISPVVFSSSVVAISTENTCTPFLVTISSGWKGAACLGKPANAPSMANNAAITHSRGPGWRTTKPKYMDEPPKPKWNGRKLTRGLRQRPEPRAAAGSGGLKFPSAGFVASVRGQRRRPGLGMDLGGHHALGARPEPHQHILARTQLGHAEAAQRFHVHEDVRRALTAGQEAKTAQPVEPFDLGPLQARGRGN